MTTTVMPPRKFHIATDAEAFATVAEALEADWKQIGADFNKAMLEVAAELRPEDSRSEEWDRLTAALKDSIDLRH